MKHKKRLKEQDYKIAYQLSAVRLPMPQIAEVLGVSKETLERMMKTNDELRDAIQRGRNDASTKARGTLFSMATRQEVEKEVVTIVQDEHGREISRSARTVKKRVDPDTKSLMFWCRTQEGFKMVDNVEVSGIDGGPIKTKEYTMTDEQIIEKIKKLKDLYE